MFVLLVGCQSADAVEPPAPKPPPPRQDHELVVRFHMYRKLDLGRAIERLLIRGKLDDARALAKNLANAPELPGLEVWARESALVREQAVALANATSVDDGCRRAAQLAAACASCHEKAGVVATFEMRPPLPNDQPTIVDRMARHTWAADRMWEGMIGAADEPWRAGAEVLAQAPLPFSLLTADRVLLAKQLQRLGDQALQRVTTDSLAERARLYGEILVTCAGCHSVKPGERPEAVAQTR